MKYIDKKISQAQSDEIITPLELDLLAYFKILQDATFLTLQESIDNGDDEKEAIKKIEKILK